ncbi:uncharacterized protein LOC144564427 [Carex rostrata]
MPLHEKWEVQIFLSKTILRYHGSRNVKMYDLPELTQLGDLTVNEFREVADEMAIKVDEEHLRLCDSLNLEQLTAFNEIMQCVIDRKSGVFFIDGSSGTGKTYLYKTLLAKVRSMNHIALATASSGCAANNMPGGRTAHSRFKIPLKIENNSVCNIKKQSGIAQLLRMATLIIWDEASMAKRQAIEALERTMQDIIE